MNGELIETYEEPTLTDASDISESHNQENSVGPLAMRKRKFTTYAFFCVLKRFLEWIF